jgi:GDPmannose 4,6-dehydratase
MRSKRALIIGVGGQDGYYMSHLLVDRGYHVTGLLLPSDMSAPTVPFLPRQDMELVQGSVCNADLLRGVISDERPHQVYNFSGVSFIPASWEIPVDVAETNGLAVVHILDAIRCSSPASRFLQAGSSEMFGHDPEVSPQDENTPFKPDNPYASSKVFAAHLARNYRTRYGLYACVAIFYNHESPWRPPNFVTRKICLAAASISMGKSEKLLMGDLDSMRDWSYAGDITEAAYLMLSANAPKDYVLASGKLHSVKDILRIAFEYVGLSWESYVKVTSDFKRAKERRPLWGNPSAAMNELGWKPRVEFEEMIRMMVDKDLERLRNNDCQAQSVSVS